MATTVVAVVGSGGVVDAPWPHDAAAVETGDYFGSSDKATRVLGWRPTVALDEGLRRTWSQLRVELAPAP